MPRVNRAEADGLRVPGLYQSMLVRERDAAERDDRRRVEEFARTGECTSRPRDLLVALLDGKSVLIGRAHAELEMHCLLGGRQRLPWTRSVRTVRVSPDDVLLPTDVTVPWRGCAADSNLIGR